MSFLFLKLKNIKNRAITIAKTVPLVCVASVATVNINRQTERTTFEILFLLLLFDAKSAAGE